MKSKTNEDQDQVRVLPFTAATKCRNSAMIYATSICRAAQAFDFDVGDAFRWVYSCCRLEVFPAKFTKLTCTIGSDPGVYAGAGNERCEDFASFG